MKEHPIPFTADMVRAILDGRKTQTRRVIKPQFTQLWGFGVKHGDEKFSCHVDIHEADGTWKWVYCPYGMKGDHLWTRETYGVYEDIICCPDDLPNFKDKEGIYHPVVHFAGKENYAWGMYGPPRKRSGRFMPRSAARLTLEIVSIRVGRVQEISEADAIAEGILISTQRRKVGIPYYGVSGEWFIFAREAYQFLWDKINAPRGFGWNANPWVWVIDFRMFKP